MLKKYKLVAAVAGVMLMAMFTFSACGIINEVVDFEGLRTLDGVEMTTEKTTYEVGNTDITVAWTNDTDKTLTFGESYYLVKKVNSKWKKVSPIPNIAFIAIGYTMGTYSQANHTYELGNVYKASNLKSGTYRIVTHFFDNADIPVTSDEEYWVYAEFEFANVISTSETGHFFRASFGGSLINLPYEAYRPDTQPFDDYGSLSILMSDVAQLGIFDGTYSQTWSETENNWVRDERFSDLIGSYDENFFADKQIVTFFLTAAGGAYYFELSSAVYSGGILTIEVNHISGGMGHAALVDWFGIVEIEKVPADAEIVIKVNNRGW